MTMPRKTFVYIHMVIVLLLIAITNGYCQGVTLSNPEIDSLKGQLQFKSDSQRVDLLNKIAYQYYYYYNDSTDDYALEALKLSDSLNYTKGLAEAQRMMGIHLKAKNRDKESIAWLYKGLETAKSINYHQAIGDILNSIGILYSSIEAWDKSISYFKESVVHQLIEGNILREGILYTNIGVAYLNKGQLDSSQHYFDKSKVIIDSIGNERWQAMVFSQYGALYIAQGELEQAEISSKKAIELGYRNGQQFHLRKSYQNLSVIYLKKNEFELCDEMVSKAMELSYQIGFIPYLIKVYDIKYQLLEKQGQYENALKALKTYTSLKDSLMEDQIRSEADLLTYQIELQRKEEENLLLRSENESKEARNQANQSLILRQTVVGLAIILTLVAVSVLAIILFRLRQKEHETNTKLIGSNKALEEQKEELTATLQMVEHLNSHLRAQDNTLNKIAIVSITDLDGNIVSVNDNFCEVSGYDHEELTGENHRILNSGHHPKKVFGEMWQTIITGNTWRGELKNMKKNGEFFWADTAIAPILDDEGNPKQFFALQFDITERENYLDEISSKSDELEELNKLKDKLLSVISHDFRGPLNSLRGALALFVSGSISMEEMKVLGGGLVEKLDNTYNLLENLLSWAKSQMQGTKVYMKSVSLDAITEDCIHLLEPLAEKKLVRIFNNIREPIVVYADNEMVKLVLRNLVSNAIKFTLAGDEINIDSMVEEDFVTISVKDNGIGISNENQDKLFKLMNFSTSGTSNETGMGLGLLLCKDFVEKQGGRIWFESEYGKGSTFYFTLPMEEKFAIKTLSEFS